MPINPKPLEEQTAEIVRIPEELIGKDEMNLVELPFAMLSQRNPERISVREVYWTAKGEDGLMRNFYEKTTGHPEWGLPTFQGEEVYIALMKITKDQGFQERRVHTTKYEILQTMRWTDQGSNYRRLMLLLDQLVALTIYSNAFWDKKVKGYKEKAFGIIDEYEFFEGERRGRRTKEGSQTLPFGFFRWNETLFESFQNGYIKSLNTDTYFGLRTYTSKRLYRYVDKQLYAGEPFEIDLYKLARVKLGMSESTLQYPSRVAEKLQPALEEHLEKRIARIKIKRSTTESGYKVVVTPFSKTQIALSGPSSVEDKRDGGESGTVAQLVNRGITEEVARTLVGGYPDRIEPKIQVFDWLIQTHSPLIEKNPAGFLRRSIEEDWQPPPGFVSKAEREQQAEQARKKKQQKEAKEREVLEQERAEVTGRRVESPYNDLWEQMAEELRGKLPPQVFASWIEPTWMVEVEGDTVVLGVSDRFFARWVEEHYAGGIEEVLSAIRGVPTKLGFTWEASPDTQAGSESESLS